MTYSSITELSYGTILTGAGALVGAILVSFAILSYFTHDKIQPPLIFKLTAETINAKKHKNKCISYGNQYYTELENLEERKLSDDELKGLYDSIVKEETPEGVIIMRYNVKTNRYEYFTDNKTVTNRILDAVCRKYAITYDCKQVCLNHRQEIQRVRDKLENNTAATQTATVPESSKNSSVFVKKYCKSKPNKKVVLENMNFFTCKGRLCDYEEVCTNKINLCRETLTFLDYKKLQEKNKKK